MAQGSPFARGRVNLSSDAAVFKQAKTAHSKELSVLAMQSPAQPLVTNNGKVIRASHGPAGQGPRVRARRPVALQRVHRRARDAGHVREFSGGKNLRRWLLK